MIELRRRTPEEQRAYAAGFKAGVEMALSYVRDAAAKVEEIARISAKLAPEIPAADPDSRASGSCLIAFHDLCRVDWCLCNCHRKATG